MQMWSTEMEQRQEEPGFTQRMCVQLWMRRRAALLPIQVAALSGFLRAQEVTTTNNDKGINMVSDGHNVLPASKVSYPDRGLQKGAVF